MLSPEQTVIFRGQRLIIYTLLVGQIPQEEATGEACLKYTLHGKSYEEKVTFSLQPKTDDNLTVHRLAAKSMIQSKDFGFRETTLVLKRDVLDISLESGVMSSFTAFVAINKELNEPVQGPLVHREIPRPILLGGSSTRPRNSSDGFPKVLPCSSGPVSHPPRSIRTGYCAVMAQMPDGAPPQLHYSQRMKCVIHTDTRPELPNILRLHTYQQGSMEHTVAQLILLQNANGSWDMNEDLAKVLGISLEDIKAAHPTEVLEPSAWATMLAVIWLHANGKELKCEWSLLERKAVVWLHNNAVRGFTNLMRTANNLLKTSVKSSVFTLKD